MSTEVLRIAAFSDGNAGGNPAGVVIGDAFPSVDEMRRIAAEVGFSETAFAMPQGDGWRVRYFSPASEVPFCGHATIGLGAALAAREGDGVFALRINSADITVEGRKQGALYAAALQSPPTRSRAPDPGLLREAMSLLALRDDEFDPRIAPAHAHGGADHLVLMLRDRARLAAMDYDLAMGKILMDKAGWVTILLGWIESNSRFHTRNAFASGGVLEDPATGAATAAFAGYLRDLHWPHGGAIDVVQGEDMGSRSLLHAEIPAAPGASIRVSGTARWM
jgi:PhzF family phenazine biosynthesis protein